MSNGDASSSGASIVITAVRTDEWLRQAVASSLAQIAVAAQVIVVLDGCSGMDASDFDAPSGLTFVRLAQRHGPARARNLGLEQADGEYVAALDGDDLADADRLARQTDLIRNLPGVALVGGAARTMNADGSSLGIRQVDRLNPMQARLRLTQRNPFVHSATLARRSALEAVGGYDETLTRCIDYDLYLRLAIRGYSLATDPEIVGTHRVHGGQLSTHAIPGPVRRHLRSLRSELAAELDISTISQHLRNAAWSMGNTSIGREVRGLRRR
ncbi:MAG: glycosyltransferase [Actinomycetota bacterium]|nr:glycosyltransferase [Actinomycetota bacterium]